MARLNLALIAGPVYDPLYERLEMFTSRSGIETEIVMHLPQHELNKALEANFSGSTPDIPLDLITCHSKYAPSQRHFLRPLDDLLTAEELAPFSSSMREFATIEGRLYQLPRNCDVRVLIYRRDLFESAGERPPRTWDEAVGTAAALSDAASGTSGFVFTGRLSGLFGSFYELLASAGGEFLDAEMQPAFVSAQGSWALNTLRELYATAVPEMKNYSYDDVAYAFAAGKVGFYAEWPGYWGLLTDPSRSQVSDDLGVALYPQGPAGVRRVYAGSHSFAIPTSARNVDASLELLRFLTSDESLLVEARSGSLVPKRTVLDAVLTEAPLDSLVRARWLALLETMESHILLPPRSTVWPDIEDALWPALQRGFSGAMSTEDALLAAADKVREAQRLAPGP